jgi:hypothetical protein
MPLPTKLRRLLLIETTTTKNALTHEPSDCYSTVTMITIMTMTTAVMATTTTKQYSGWVDGPARRARSSVGSPR